ncbi:MAG TPA: glycoside hydrolase family 2 TIM barrel-domain containing protein [Opitutaceae bacterium]
MNFLLRLGLACLCVAAPAVVAAPIPVEVRESAPGRFELWREGAPYYVRGAGGSHRLDRLAAAGGNSVRTWGAEEAEKILDEAQRLGLTVCAGLWIEHENQGFNYNDDAAVQAQIERHCRAVDRLKDHPALLVWGVGNEAEMGASNPRLWEVIEAVAAYIQRVDPHHPVMTVTAGVPPWAIRELMQRCPSVDLLGVNSYGPLTRVADDVRAVGWRGAYLVTEWGPDGTWEVEKTPWGAEIEATSTATAVQRAYRYAAILGDRDRCVGSYAFLWGQKQEGTPTWFGLFTEAGGETESVEMLAALWSRRDPSGLTPRIGSLRLNGAAALPGVRVASGARAAATCPIIRGEQLRVTWELLRERMRKSEGGAFEPRPPTLPVRRARESLEAGAARLEFNAPSEPGAYRLFIYVQAPGGQVATANIPFRVE